MKNSFAAAVLLALAAPAAAQQPSSQASSQAGETPSQAPPTTQPDPASAPLVPQAASQVMPQAVPFAPGDLERLLAARPVVNGPLSLDEAVATALRESPVLRGAEDEVEAALGRLNAARAERKPMLSANTFLSGGSLPNIVESPQLPIARMIMGLPRGAYFDQNLMLMAPILTGGRLKALVRQAQAGREASQAELEGQRQEIALLARTAYREVQARRALVDVQQARLRENEEQLRLDRIRAQEGKIPPFFVLRQEAEVAATQQELTNAARDVELSLLQLRTVMGVNPASNFSIPGTLEYQPSVDFIARLSGASSTKGGSALNVATPNAAVPILPEAGNSGASSPQVPAPATGSTAPGVAAPGSEVPGVQESSSSAAPPGATAPGAPTPDVGSTVPPASTSGASTSGASTSGASTSGASTSSGSASPLPNTAGIPAGLSALLRVAERGRPELRAAGLRIAGAELETSAIGAAYKPQVNAFVMGDIGQSGGFGSSRGSSRFGGVTFGVAASVPLYTGGRRSAAIQSAQAARRRLESEREQVALEVARSVSGAFLNLNASEQNILTAQAALRSAQEDYRVARIRYESGRSIVVEVLDAQATRVRAESNLVQALFGYNVARDQLLRAVGVLDPSAPTAPIQ